MSDDLRNSSRGLLQAPNRVEEIIEQLESGTSSREEGDRLFEEGRKTLDEIREIIGRCEGAAVELPE